MNRAPTPAPPLSFTFDADHLDNPYPQYRRLRAAHPLYRDASLSAWVATGHAAVQSALRDDRFVSDRLGSEALLAECGRNEIVPIFEIVSRMLLFANPPAHTRVRDVARQAFSQRALDGTRALVQDVLNGLLQRIGVTAGASVPVAFDLMADVARPLPALVLGRMLGVPEPLADEFRQWWYDVMAAIKRAYLFPDERQEGVDLLLKPTSYLRQLVIERRAHPGEDIISIFASAGLSDDELVATCALLLSVGQESASNLIGNGMLALLRHPDQLRLLAEDDSLAANAIEELLRFDSPVQFTGRRAATDADLAGHRIPAGDHIMLVIGAANRDPAVFEAPDSLDIRRRDIRHLSFGAGTHFCLGASLARLEGHVAITTLLRHCSNLRLSGVAPRWRDTRSARGLTHLHLAAGRGPRLTPAEGRSPTNERD